ncbi:MAG: 4Fe-4S dicluster domain-containing protein [Dehalococcoidales bacterium]|nr:4Fe-4S dicluster domain-containing protein [Dehalococcoidales bacterium]
MKKIKKQDLNKLLAQWQKQYTVFTPSNNGVVKMTAWDGKDTTFLDWYRNTVIPPKKNFLPNMEKMFVFQNDGKTQLQPVDTAADKQLVFGVRPCDAHALSLIDLNFTDGYEDVYYVNRRKNGLLVGMGCASPCASCFCTSLGIEPGDSKDVDIMVNDIGGELLITEITDKGKALLAATSGLEEATAADEAKAKQAKESAHQKVSRKINTAEIKERLMPSFENEEHWEKVAAKCVSCGICTFLCPTCYCFDINDEQSKGKGARFRNWDCCSFPVYTRMPMENPREDKWRRVRQKVNHKYSFFPMIYDKIACTGCGRCIRQCPVNWDITQVLSTLPVKAKA